ncbi:MAG: hypothetical protein ISQ08_10795 [Planctomycetes bacterium]|nr:hypothetical protein [Planctomycetota bacterium]
MTTESHLDTSMNITLHLPTAAITVAIGSLALFGMSATAPQSTSIERDVQAFQDTDRPRAEDMVWIHTNGSPNPSYTVPPGRGLILTHVAGASNYVELVIDGGPARRLYENGTLSSGIGLTEGQTITVLTGGFNYSLLGYLIDA